MTGSTFGALLRRHRLSAGLSQEALAELARMSARGVGALERGDRQHPYRETVLLLGKALRLGPAAAAEFEAAAARPRQSTRRVSPQGTIADERSSMTNLPCQRIRNNLPAYLTPCIGREADTAAVAALLEVCRLVTLTGTGGIGKTRASLEVAAETVDHFADGVWFVELGSLSQPSLVASAIAQTLNVKESPNRPLLDSLLSQLKQKSALLILDNCEHVVAEAAAVAGALLRSCPRLRIMATSREPLRIEGERNYRLPPLRVPTLKEAARLDAPCAARYAAVALFVERARAVDREFAFSDQTAPVIAELCLRLDGIPLAIELAAARANVLPVRDLLVRLDRRLTLLTEGSRTAPFRHQTIRTLIDWSYDLLSPAEQRLFECISVFAGGCTTESIAAVYAGAGADEFVVLELLKGLVDKSLVVADLLAPEPRFRLLESSRQYASEKLVARGDYATVARRHATVHLELAARLERLYESIASLDIIRQAETEIPNWRSALTWMLDAREDVVAGQHLAGLLHWVWAHFSYAEGRRWIRAALPLVDERTPPAVVGQLEYVEALIAREFSEINISLAAAARAVAAFRLAGDVLGVARAQAVQGRALAHLGHVMDGELVLREALEAARTLNNRSLAARIQESIALNLARGGDAAGARSYFTEALAINEELGLESAAATVNLTFAEAEFLAGDVDAALRISADALATFRAIDQRYSVVNVLSNIAAYLTARNAFDAARTHAREALELAFELELDVHVAWAAQHLAAIAALRPGYDTDRPSEQHVRAGRILGFVEARLANLEVIDWYTEKQEFDRAIGVLRASIGEDKLSLLLAAGASMTVDGGVKLALSI